MDEAKSTQVSQKDLKAEAKKLVDLANYLNAKDEFLKLYQGVWADPKYWTKEDGMGKKTSIQATLSDLKTNKVSVGEDLPKASTKETKPDILADLLEGDATSVIIPKDWIKKLIHIRTLAADGILLTNDDKAKFRFNVILEQIP